MVKRKRIKFGIFSQITISTGLALMVASFLIYTYSNNNYLQSIQSEMFGGGIILLIAGLVYLKKKIKLT